MLLKIKGRDHSMKDIGCRKRGLPAHSSLTRKRSYPFAHLFHKHKSGVAGRGQRPCCPSPEVGRGARLWDQLEDGAISFTEGHE